MGCPTCDCQQQGQRSDNGDGLAGLPCCPAPEMLEFLRGFLSVDMRPVSAYRRCASCFRIAEQSHDEGCKLAALLGRLK